MFLFHRWGLFDFVMYATIGAILVSTLILKTSARRYGGVELSYRLTICFMLTESLKKFYSDNIFISMSIDGKYKLADTTTIKKTQTSEKSDFIRDFDRRKRKDTWRHARTMKFHNSCC